MENIDPYAFATQGRQLEGTLPVSALARLIPLLATDDTEEIARYQVDYTLLFGTDQGGVRGVLGKLEATLPLKCQRCMGKMQMVVHVDIQIGFVSSRKAAEILPESYDPLLVTDDGVTVNGIVEDELILALPLVAMHEIKDCPKGETFQEKAQDNEGDAPKRKNPFAMLATLKTSQSNKDD
ncbi:MAG: DUF177 domain-containing protein [Ectothiorhodospiraceae bacterium]|nr:DUF177 domain-containing protein [Ectothiorhodospiraceae bacterium]